VFLIFLPPYSLVEYLKCNSVFAVVLPCSNVVSVAFRPVTEYVSPSHSYLMLSHTTTVYVPAGCFPSQKFASYLGFLNFKTVGVADVSVPSKSPIRSGTVGAAPLIIISP
jgi:hypothetical protein